MSERNTDTSVSRRTLIRTVGVGVGLGTVSSTATGDAGAGTLDARAATRTSSTGAALGEVGSVTTDQPDASTWFSVSFDRSYDDPVVVMKSVSANGEYPVHVRLRNVTGDGFEFQLEEWDYQNGRHVTETVTYLALESGVHTLEDGTTVEAGTASTDWLGDDASFSAAFDSPPVVFAQSQTRNEAGAIITRHGDVTTDGLHLQLQEEEATKSHDYETVGYVAFEPVSGTLDGHRYEVGVEKGVSDDDWKPVEFANDYGSPAFLSDIHTFREIDTSEVRYQNLDGAGAEVIIEEEQSDDDETDHAEEQVSYATFEDGTTLYAAPVGPTIGEVRSVTTDQPDTGTWFPVAFDHSYDDPVVVMKSVSYNGGDPCHVRLRNVTGDGFEFQLEEWDYLDGPHTTETVTFLVMESGVHTLPDGTTVEAGTASTDWLGDGASFSSTFDSPPVVFAQSQTRNDAGAIITRHGDVTSYGLHLQLQEEEATKSHDYETVGYVAFDPSSGTVSATPDGDPYEVGVVNGVSDDDWDPVEFANDYGSPAFLSDIQTFREIDTSEVRYRSLDGTGAEVIIEEEQSNDDETDHAEERVAYATFEDGTTLRAAAGSPATGAIGEVGSLTPYQLDDSVWHSVGFDGSYEDPVVVMKPVSYEGTDPCHVRLRDVGPNGFEFQLEEWKYDDGGHAPESVTYLVVESGVHTLADGRTIEADAVDYSGYLFDSVNFSANFDAPPASFAQVRTTNESLPLVTRQRDLTADGVEVSVQEEEAESRSDLPETINYVAVEPGSGTVDGNPYEFGVAANVDDYWAGVGFSNDYGSPAFLADMRTYNGGNTSGLRYRNLDGSGAEVFVEEEQSADYETSHTYEDVSYAVFEDGTKLYPRVAGEVGTVTTDQPDASTWRPVTFDESYADPVVVAKPVGYNGQDPCHVRLRNVGSNGFEFQIEEWKYLDGPHTVETITYVVVESGVHTLADGRTIEADAVDYSGYLFDSVSFSADFDAPPVSFAQVQTTNESLPLITRQRDLTANGVEVSVQEEEAEDRSDLPETIGYVAVEAGTGTLAGPYEFGVTPDVDDNWASVGFSNDYGSPAFLADMRTYDGGNTSGLRYRNLDSAGAEVFVEEEQSADDETSHTTEDVSYAAFEAGASLDVK